MRFSDPRFRLCHCALDPRAAAAGAGVDPVFSNQFEDGSRDPVARSCLCARQHDHDGHRRTADRASGRTGRSRHLRADRLAGADASTVAGGGTAVLAGETDAVVTMNALSGDSTPVLLRAQLGNVAYGSVRVVDDAEPRNSSRSVRTPRASPRVAAAT